MRYKNIMLKEILNKINLDKYYKLIPIAGIIFIILGISYNINKLFIWGILTFLYGILTWMIGTFFHIKADIKIGILNKWSPLHIVIIFIIINIIIFITYCVLTVTIFTS